MANNNDIEKNANKFSQSRPENGKEFEQMQTAQNQLLGIQATQKQNLMEQRLAESNLAAQNDVMRQAAELGAMSGGNMYVNQATQGVMGRYGLQKPMTSSSKKTIRTPQGIVINNNTTNITTVPANIGGPLQGRPLQFQAGGTAEQNNFKNWISKAFDKQNEEAKKREREYSRRESSLTKSSNKIMRKLEEFSRDITKKLDPRNIGRTVGGQIGTIFKLFGMGYLAANTGKILDGIKKFVDGGKELFSWIKGDSKETPKFIKDITDSFSESFGRVLYGDNVDNDGVKKHGLLWGLWNNEGKGIINQFFDSLMDKVKERSDYAKSVIKFPKDIDSNNLPQNIGALLNYLTSYISILLGGDKSVGKSFESELKIGGDDLRDGKELKKQAEAVHGASSRVGYMSKEEMGTGSATAMQNGWKQLENGDFIKEGVTPWSRGASSYISSTGQEKAKYLLPNHMDRKGRLIGSDISQAAVVSDLANAYANRNKPGAGMQMFNDLRAMYHFSKTNDLPMIADPKDVASILGISESEVRSVPHLITVRDKQVCDKYPGMQVTANAAGKAAVNGMFAEGITSFVGGGMIVAGAVAGVVALIPGVNLAVGIAALGVGLAGKILKSLPVTKLAVGTSILSSAASERRANARDLQEGFVRLDPFSMKQYWTIYGDYMLPLTRKGYEDLQKSNSALKRMGLVIDEISDDKSHLKYKLVKVMPNYENFEKILESAYIEGDVFVINFKDNLKSLFDNRYLNNVVLAARQGYIESKDLAVINDEMNQAISDKISGQTGFTPVLDSSNSENIAAMAQNIGGKGGNELLDLANRMSTASEEAEWTDSISNQGAVQIPETGEKKGMKTTRNIVRDELESSNGNVSWANNGAPSESSVTGSPATGGFDIQAAVDHIVGHALPSPGAGQCGTHVLDSLAAGGLRVPRGKESAYMYKDVLLNNGWEVVTDGSLQPGDVEIYDKVEGKHPHGHMQMWTGNGWYSDFGQKGEDPYRVKGSGGKITRLRYTRAGGAGVTPQVTPGSLGQLPDSSGVKSDSEVGDSTSFWDVIKNGVSDVWNKSKVKVVETADGKLMEMVGTQEWINGAVGRGTPVDVNMRPYSGFTRDILRKYSGADYTSGGLSYLDKFGITGTNRASRRVLSSLFDENGKLRINTNALDPELATRLKNIEAELKKGNEIDIAQVNISAAGIDTTINASRAQSVATNQALAAYTKNNNRQAQSMTDSEAN